MITPISTLKRWFANFKKPTQEQFWAWLDSYWHKSEKIPMDTIDGLENAIRGTASADQLRNHLTDSQAHQELFATKVDKEAGKGLSSNDYTNEEKRTNQANAKKRVVNLTVTGDVDKIITLTFADGTALQAPFTDKDTLPENLADIKLNSLNFNHETGVLTGLRSDGQQLTVSLDGRYALIGHTHPEYAYRTHTHSEYAPKEHRHNWDDIDGKPEIATEGKIQVGGRNYALNSKDKRTLVGYVGEYWNLSEPIKVGVEYTFSCYANVENGKRLTVYFKDIEGQSRQYIIINLVNGYNKATVIPSYEWTALCTYHEVYGISPVPTANIEKIKFEKGNTATDWTPAPEDLLYANNTKASGSIVLTHAHNNATIFLEGNSTVDLSRLEDLDCVSFRKIFYYLELTFTCPGKNIIYTGDNTFKGGEGSTAVVSIYRNKCYIDIRNV
nr:hypothetical protein [uncultured Capnocytophaga sp.]